MYYYIPFVLAIVGMIFGLAVIGSEQYETARTGLYIYLVFWLLFILVFVGAFGGNSPRNYLENWRLPGWVAGAKLAINIPVLLLFMFMLGIVLWRRKRRNMSPGKQRILEKIHRINQVGFLGIRGSRPNVYRDGTNSGAASLKNILEEGDNWPAIVRALVAIRKITGYPAIPDYMAAIGDNDLHPYDKQVAVRIGEVVNHVLDRIAGSQPAAQAASGDWETAVSMLESPSFTPDRVQGLSDFVRQRLSAVCLYQLKGPFRGSNMLPRDCQVEVKEVTAR